uniref:Decapping nuclease n=1 Tax=Caenorhabditis tropicalis TaxID=1561998 RepID=A0A1I7UGZ7_9PELO
MAKFDIKVIDYYHRDDKMNTKKGEPKKLNENMKYIEDPQALQPVNLNIPVKDSGAGEKHIESLLNHIKMKWAELQTMNADFVTNKNLLRHLALTDVEMNVFVVRKNGVIFMYREEVKNDTHSNNVAAFCTKNFEHFMTKKTENEEIEENGTVRKAVFMAEIPMEDREPFKVMYSGEIDAIDGNEHLYELKVLSGGTNDYFWKERSCGYYWLCFFSKVGTMIIGSRTDKHPKDPKTRPPSSKPEYSLYKISTLNVDEIPKTAMEKAASFTAKTPKQDNNEEWKAWTVEEGEKNVQKFLRVVYEKVTNDGDGFKVSKQDGNWSFVEDKVNAFYEDIMTPEQ